MPAEGAAASVPAGHAVHWDAPPGIGALMTLRTGGQSRPPWDGLNLGDHVGDDPTVVLRHRDQLATRHGVRIAWLQQVHGCKVVNAAQQLDQPAQADASWTDQPGVACAVLVADCLPVLLAARNGRAVGAAHAGWRGLAAGVVEAAVRAVAQAAGGGEEGVVAWLGPCIGPEAFEVGDDVAQAFGGGPRFSPSRRVDGSPAWRADLAGLARDRLLAMGVTAVAGEGLCTVADRSRFFSYRRDGRTGRMAAAVWLRG